MADPLLGIDLPSIVPAPEDDIQYYTIVQDKFTYSINYDEDTWDTWVAAVEDVVTYSVNPLGAGFAATKFSPFLIYWKCNTETQYDGCCMLEDTNGAVCTLDTVF